MASYMESPKVSCGRRSKKPLGVIIHKLPNGFDDVNGYFPPSDDEFDNDADIFEEMEEPSTKYLKSDCANETPSLISEDELCREERLVTGNDEIADIASRLTSRDELDRSSDMRSSKKSSRKSTKSFTDDGSPRYVLSFVENASDAVSAEDTATPGMLAKNRPSGVGVALRSSSSKIQNTPTSPVSKIGSGQEHKQESRVDRLSDSKDSSFSTSPSKISSIKKKTPQRKKTPKADKALGSQRRQRNENSQQNKTVNASVRKDVSPAKSPKRGLEPGKDRKIGRKKSMRSTAVSTDELANFGYYVEDGDKNDIDVKNEMLLDENEHEFGNRKIPTRYIIIEKSPRFRSRKVVGGYNDVGTGSLRESKLQRLEPRYYSSRKKRPVDLTRESLSTSGDERPYQRAKAPSNGNRSEPSQRRKRSRRQPQKRKSPSVVDSRILPNKEEGQKVGGKNRKKITDHCDVECAEEGMKLTSAEKRKPYHTGKMSEQRKSLGKHKSEGIPSVQRKRPSSTPLYDYEVEESLDSGRFNRLENKKSLTKKSSFKPTELPKDFPVDENKEELLDSIVTKPQVKKKVRRKRIQRVTYPTRKKKIKVEKVESIDQDYVRKSFENNGNEADGEATQNFVYGRASANFQSPKYLIETPKSRSSSLILSDGKSGWVGPCPFPTGSSSLHRVSAQNHPAANEVNEVKEKKRRKGTRLCYPAAQRKSLQKKAKYSGVSVNISEAPSKRFSTTYDERVDRDMQDSQSEDEHKIKKRGKKSTNEFKEKLYANVSPTMFVRDSNDELVSMNLVFTPAMLRLAAPGRLADGREYTEFLLHKFFEHPLFNAGRFALLPMAEKGHQFVQRDTLLFQVVSGEVDFVMEGEKKRLGAGCTFFVPCGNAYNIKNVRREMAMIFFVQIKG